MDFVSVIVLFIFIEIGFRVVSFFEFPIRIQIQELSSIISISNSFSDFVFINQKLKHICYGFALIGYYNAQIFSLKVSSLILVLMMYIFPKSYLFDISPDNIQARIRIIYNLFRTENRKWILLGVMSFLITINILVCQGFGKVLEYGDKLFDV